jgi:diguanylate cyclase (GGDEF)-like protein
MMPGREPGAQRSSRDGGQAWPETDGPAGFGLRARLAAFFIAITVVPLGLATIGLQVPMNNELRKQTEEELLAARAATISLLEAQRDRSGDLANDLTERLSLAVQAGALPPEPLSDEAAVQAWLTGAVAEVVPGRADLVVLAGPDGSVVAEVAAPADFFHSRPVPAVSDLPALAAAGEPTTGVLLEARQLRGPDDAEAIGWLLAGRWTDNRLLGELGLEGGAALTVESWVLAATPLGSETIVTRDVGDTGEGEIVELGGQDVVVTSAPLQEDGADPTRLLLWAPSDQPPSPLTLALVVLLPAVVVAGLLGWLLATSVVAPIRRAAEAARAVAAGDLQRKLPAGGGAELADLATALNTMSDQLTQRLAELSRSRDRLRGSLDRLGQTLSSSLDLNATLAVVVETAMEILGADRGLLMLHTPERDALYLKVGRGLHEPPPRLEVGEGLLGHVAGVALPVRLPADAEELPEPVPGEPVGAHELIVPLHGRGMVLGVVALLRDDPEREFSAADLRTLQSFATQASVAIENVLLHREARRLSVTDSLTGLWNFRYFEIQADREMESAARSGRPLSLMIVDIDHFKSVNDDHGHQVGDAVLTEIAARIRSATRTPDVVARYGGEEFVVLLPGTDFEGALATGERVRRSVSVTPVPVAVGSKTDSDVPDSLPITCSVGVATFPSHGDTVADLLRSADAAMYAAKQRGRNRVVGAERAQAPEGA